MRRSGPMLAMLTAGLSVCRVVAGAEGAAGPGAWFSEAGRGALVRGLSLSSSVSGRASWDAARRRLSVTAAPTPAAGGEVAVFDATFHLGSLAADAPYEPLSYSEQTWYGSTFWTGPDWTRVGRDWHHPGDATPSVRCFRAPRDGQVTITGRVYKLHRDGDGVRLMIRQGGRELWRAEIDGQDGVGAEPRLTVAVHRGDAIRFIVHKRGTIFCDTTHWDPVVTYSDGEAFRASDSFGDRQGAGNWFYEMLVDDQSGGGDPRLRLAGPDALLREVPLPAGVRAQALHSDALPLAVLSDGAERSCVWLAVDGRGPWRLECSRPTEDELNVRVTAGAGQNGAGATLPGVILGAGDGPWTAALGPLAQLLGEGEARGGVAHGFHDAVADPLRQVTRSCAVAPELDLLLMTEAEWLAEDGLGKPGADWRSAALRHLAGARALLSVRPDAAGAAERLDALQAEAGRLREGDGAWAGLYLQVRLAKRDLLLGDPLLGASPVLFCKRVPTSYSHLVMQYFGWRARPGGGLFVLQRPGRSLACRDILRRRLPAGNVLEPRLSWDARWVVFSWVACPAMPYRPEALAPNEQGPDEGYYHVYEVNLDGTGLRQLTRGPYDDVMPVYLPDGGIAFCSTRRRGMSRCFGAQFSARWHSYTLHRMDADGAHLRCLSRNDVSEWFPEVNHAGQIVYARWDYIDRDAVTHQNLWTCRPDGSNPATLWGNATPAPNCTFQAKAVPGSGKYVAIASAHHSITAGPVCLVDPRVDVTDLAALTRLTPGPLPEAEGWELPGYFSAPWPLSERYFLVAYCPGPLRTEGEQPNAANALGLYALDAAGNRELLYRDPAIGSDNPTLLAPRPVPPVVAPSVAETPAPEGELLLLDAYRGLAGVARGSIKRLRVIQIFPKTTVVGNTPPIGLAGEENGRAILGTVPVEADGSARFAAPAGKALLFQALDAQGRAVQTMRSLTYLQPGERVSCVGCHEERHCAPPARRPLAASRPPSNILAGDLEGEPFSFMRTVQPVLDAHCARCHSGARPARGLDLTATPDRGFTRSYWSLLGDPAQFQGTDVTPERAATALVPRFGMRNQLQVTPPGGMYGSPGCLLLWMLRDGHHGVQLSASETARLASWVDCNAIFYGVYEPADQAAQLAGKPVPMPQIQ